MLIWVKQIDRRVTSLIIINTIFFLAISLVHFYWAARGTYGNLAVLPLTGVTFPFVSFGMTSLLVNMALLALCVHINVPESVAHA